LQENRAYYFNDREAFVAAFPKLAGDLDTVGMRAVATLPLLDSGGDAIGAIAFAFANPQPFDDEQQSLLQTAADVTAQSLDRARLYERERDVARTLQLALLPAALPSLEDVRIEARYVAGGGDVSVGGDWYDVLRFADGRIGLFIGDAAGRGVEAATFMGKVRHAAAALAMEYESPAVVLRHVNDYLHSMSSRRSMLTCCYIVVDGERRTLRYASAGHPPPLLRVTDDNMTFLDRSRGVPLGVVAGAEYEDAEHVLTAPSTLVLYTDGLVERRGESIDAGLARLRETLRAFDGEVERLCDHLTASLIGEHSEDDVALLVAQMAPHVAPARLNIEVVADIARLADLRHRVARWLADIGVDQHIADDVLVAVNEAVSNSMLHAYNGNRAEGTARAGNEVVRVAMELDDDALSAVVIDCGSWRGRPEHHDGRGLQLMRALMSDVSVERAAGGTSIRMTRALSG
jgi:serine phosphatase RsbU (regulator of sigma subunit)/anti-sigma regulatory factor (Ser/Thr protein kinase)